MELMQCTVSLHGGVNVNSGTPAMHCPTALGHWKAPLLQCTATPPGGRGQGNSCNALPHCLGAVGRELLQCAGPPPGGTGSPAQDAVAAKGWVLLQSTASLPGGSEEWNSFNEPPPSSGAVSSGTPIMHFLTARRQRAVQLVRCTATPPKPNQA